MRQNNGTAASTAWIVSSHGIVLTCALTNVCYNRSERALSFFGKVDSPDLLQGCIASYDCPMCSTVRTVPFVRSFRNVSRVPADAKHFANDTVHFASPLHGADLFRHGRSIGRFAQAFMPLATAWQVLHGSALSAAATEHHRLGHWQTTTMPVPAHGAHIHFLSQQRNISIRRIKRGTEGRNRRTNLINSATDRHIPLLFGSNMSTDAEWKALLWATLGGSSYTVDDMDAWNSVCFSTLVLAPGFAPAIEGRTITGQENFAASHFGMQLFGMHYFNATQFHSRLPLRLGASGSAFQVRKSKSHTLTSRPGTTTISIVFLTRILHRSSSRHQILNLGIVIRTLRSVFRAHSVEVQTLSDEPSAQATEVLASADVVFVAHGSAAVNSLLIAPRHASLGWPRMIVELLPWYLDSHYGALHNLAGHATVLLMSRQVHKNPAYYSHMLTPSRRLVMPCTKTTPHGAGRLVSRREGNAPKRWQAQRVGHAAHLSSLSAWVITESVHPS